MQGYRPNEVVAEIAVMGDGTSTVRGLGGGLQGTQGDPSTRVPIDAFHAIARGIMNALPGPADRRTMLDLMTEYARLPAIPSRDLIAAVAMGGQGGSVHVSQADRHESFTVPPGVTSLHIGVGAAGGGGVGRASGGGRGGPVFPTLEAAMRAPAASLAEGLSRVVARPADPAPPALSPRPSPPPVPAVQVRRGRRLRIDP